MTPEEEQQQVKAVLEAAQGCANGLSLSGQHVSALQVQGVIQLARGLWTRLRPPAPEEKPALVSVPQESAAE